MDNQIFSCPCLYDHCLVSSHLKENLEEITSRISEVVNKYWLVDIDLTPTLLININKKVFVTCITHAKRMLDNLVLTSVDNELLVTTCIRSDHGGKNMNCFRFYFEEKMPAIGFCMNCIKHFLARTPHTFLLHRVKINYGGSDD